MNKMKSTIKRLHWLNTLVAILTGIIFFTATPAIAFEATVINMIDASAYGSSDPAGMTYLPDTGNILQCDSEIDEIPIIFTGVNVFEIGLAGNLIGSFGTTAYSIEPTGVVFNTVTGTLFITDDDKKQVFEVDPAAPNSYIAAFSTLDYGSIDPAGISFNPVTGNLYIVDGLGGMVYEVTPLGEFVSSIILPDAVVDAEGVYFDQASGHLFLVWDFDLFEVSLDGVLLDSRNFWIDGVKSMKGITFVMK
jgi:DNA-binding beta-propeller fold protein YncE